MIDARSVATRKPQASSLLNDAAKRRLRVTVEQGRLIIRGPQASDREFVQLLLAAKHELLTHLLQPTVDEWECWIERAAIAEWDGGQSRADAETLAWSELQERRQVR